MFPVLQIGPLAVQTPGLILLAGLWLGLSAAEKFSPRFNTLPAVLYNLALISIVAGIAGSRLAFIIQNPAPFVQNPLNIVAISSQLLNPGAGILIGGLAGLIFGQRKKLALWPTLDALTPALVILFISIAVANLASGDGYGAPTSLPWGIFLWGAVRHPSQVYEILAAILIALGIWIKIRTLGKSGSTTYRPGEIFLNFCAFTAGMRLFLDAFRGDSPALTGNIHTVQVFSWMILVLVFWLLNRIKSRKVDPGVNS